jgi:hypothetical protein
MQLDAMIHGRRGDLGSEDDDVVFKWRRLCCGAFGLTVGSFESVEHVSSLACLLMKLGIECERILHTRTTDSSIGRFAGLYFYLETSRRAFACLQSQGVELRMVLEYLLRWYIEDGVCDYR